MSAAEHERLALRFLRGLGSGVFSYREVAEGAGLKRDQAEVACLTLLRRGDVDYFQWIGDFGRDLYELRAVIQGQPAQ